MAEEELHKVCTLLDKMLLDTLTLMEQHIQNKVDVERLMDDGESDLLKARYIMGQNQVSSIQLPCQNSKEFKASAAVRTEETDEVLRDDTFEVENVKEGSINPMKFFGVLVPQALKNAQEKFRRAVQYCVKNANTQVRLNETMRMTEALKIQKEECKKQIQQNLLE